MLKYIIGILVKEMVGALSKAISDYFKLREKRKQDARLVDEALSIPDPASRANAIGSLLR